MSLLPPHRSHWSRRCQAGPTFCTTRLPPAACLTPPLPPWRPPPLRSGSEYSEAYYADLDDWLFNSALELQIVLAHLTSPPAATGGSTQLGPPADASQPNLPVFAVFAGSSKAAVPTGNGSAAVADGQPAGPRAVELLIAPFSDAARTPVPHTETRTGLDPK